MEHLFEKLTPPQGGLEGLRRKLDTREDSVFAGSLNPIRWGATTAAVLVLALVGYRLLPPEQPSEPDYGIFQRYMDTPPSETVSLLSSEGSGLRLVRQPTDNPAVTLYLIEEEDG